MKKNKKKLAWLLTLVLVLSVFSVTSPVNAKTLKSQKPTITVTSKTLKQGYTKAFSPITVKKAKGKISYAFSGKQKYFTISKKTGAIKAKAGIPVGTYRVKVKVKCAGTSSYKAYSKTVTVKVVVQKKDVGSVWSGKADTSWYTGDKTSYDITSADQLAGLAKIVNSAGDENRLEGITINLMCDVVLNNTTDWKAWTRENSADRTWIPIGQVGSAVTGYRPFAGIFNGNGHTIRGLYVNGGNECGLFAYTSAAIIENVKLDRCVIYTTEGADDSSVGVLAGICENSYFYQCKVTNARVDGSDCVGGLVGKATKVNSMTEIAYVLCLGAGIVINPLIFRAVESEQPVSLQGVFFTDCSVANVTLRSYNTWHAGDVGGIVGRIDKSLEGVGVIASCSSKNVRTLSVDLIDYNSAIAKPIDVDQIEKAKRNGAKIKEGNCGAIYGTISEKVSVGD